MTTYYVANDGGDSADGLTPATPWQTNARVNAQALVAGDVVAYQCGHVWRPTDRLIPPTSGSSGSPITFTAYGAGSKPRLSGGSLLTGWTLGSGTVYSKSVSTQPDMVAYNDALLKPHDGATGSVASGEWDWAANVLYINVGGDPASGIVEAGAVTDIVPLHQEHIVFDGLRFDYSNSAAIRAETLGGSVPGSTRVTRCEFFANDFAVDINDGSSYEIDHNLIDGGTVGKWHGFAGVESDCAGVIVHDNEILHVRVGVVSTTHAILVYDNEIHHIDLPQNPSGVASDSDLHGIDIGGGGSTGSDNSQVYRNYIHDIQGAGIVIDDSSGVIASYNLITNAGDGKYEYAIQVFQTGGPVPTGNRILNNVAYDCFGGIKLENAVNTEIKNNIVSTNSTGLRGVASTGTDSDYNCVYGNTTPYNGITAGAHDLTGDPLMAAPASGDFSLLSDSPCRDAGINVALSADYLGVSVPWASGVDIGAYEYNRTEYYVDPTGGSDSNPGTEVAPLQSLTALAGWLLGGETVHLIAGSTFRETLTLDVPGVTLIGDDSGAIIDGADRVTDWTAVSGGTEESSGLLALGAEAGAMTGWTLAGTPSVEVTTEQANHGSYSYKLSDGTGSASYPFEQQIGNMVYCRFFLWIPVGFGAAMPNTTGVPVLAMRDGNNNRGVIDVQRNGLTTRLRLYVWNPFVAIVTSGALTEGVWHQIEFSYLMSTSGGGQLWVDGASAGSNFTVNTSAHKLNRFALANIDADMATGQYLYFDDIQIDTSPIGDYDAGGGAGDYTADLALEPQHVYLDGTEIAAGTAGALADHEWNWAANVLTVHDESGDPDTTGAIIEAAVRDYCINASAAPGFSYSNVILQHANVAGLLAPSLSIPVLLYHLSQQGIL